MLRYAFFLTAILLSQLPSAQAFGAPFCKEDQLVLDRQMLWDFGGGFATQISLPTHRQGALYPSFGRANFGSGADGLLWISFENWGSDPLGIEYMVYKIEIQIGDPLEADNQIVAQDFTNNCTQPGFGIDYSKRRKLPPLKIDSHANGAARGIEPVRVRIWGWQ